MPTTKRRAATAPHPRDFAKEEKRRATSQQVKLALTPEEYAEILALVADLGGEGVPVKRAILGAVRAARLLLADATAATARREIKADLAPAKPGPKAAPEE